MDLNISKHYWLGMILICTGIFLLLDQIHLLSLSGSFIITYGFIIIGMLLLIKGYGRSDKKGVLAGTFFLCYGIILALMNESVLVRDDRFGFAAFFFCLAIGNFVYSIFRKGRGNNLLWGTLFSIIGGVLLLHYLGYYPSWYIRHQAETYWPLILILIGILLIIKGYKKQAKA